MGRNEQALVSWIASHTRFDTYRADEISADDVNQINHIIRAFNAIIHEAKHAVVRRDRR
jgi:predicted small metal-binding protein